MKKFNQIFTLALVLVMVLTCIFTIYQKRSKIALQNAEPQKIEKTITQSQAESRDSVVTTVPITEEGTEEKTEPTSQKNRNELFIGDSRAVGLMEYGKMEKIDFFANSGMSVYNIYEKKLPVPAVGKITLENLLAHKEYDTIYIMLGINEAGYDPNKTMQKYAELIDFIHQKQPNALLFLQANLHVTKERSDKDRVINNPKIDMLNQGIQKLANQNNIYYMDANVLFDDAQKGLSKEKTGDSAHPYGKYYVEWANWILQTTNQIYKEKKH